MKIEDNSIGIEDCTVMKPDALTQFENPSQSVFAGFPAFSQTGDNFIPLLFTFNQGLQYINRHFKGAHFRRTSRVQCDRIISTSYYQPFYCIVRVDGICIVPFSSGNFICRSKHDSDNNYNYKKNYNKFVSLTHVFTSVNDLFRHVH